MGFALLLGDSEKREVKISSELGTFTKQFCSYSVALKETLFYIDFAYVLVCVCYNLIRNRAVFQGVFTFPGKKIITKVTILFMNPHFLHIFHCPVAYITALILY